MDAFGWIWGRSDSGILVPAGTVMDASARKSATFVHVKGRAKEIEELYAACSVVIPSNCDLAHLLENAKLLSDRWLTNQITDATMYDVFHALHLDRIAEAILPLQSVSKRNQYLRRLCTGDLDFFKRTRSRSKNIFWELEFWSALKKRSSGARLCDPPDIVLDVDSSRIGIACKKLYSEGHVQNVLSQAVRQVEGKFDVGVVAINLDDLLPAEQVLRVKNKEGLDRILIEHNNAFLKRHERHLRSYLSSGRLVCVVVSTTVVAEVLDWRVRFNNARQATAWTIPGLPPEKECLLRRFRDIVLA